MQANTILLAISTGAMLAALCMLWMQPRAKAKPQATKTGKLTIDLDCDTTDVMAKLRPVTAELQKIAALAEKTGVWLEVREPQQKSLADRPHGGSKPPRPPRQGERVVPKADQPKHRTPEKPKRR